MSEAAPSSNKRRIAAMTLSTLSAVKGEDGRASFQLIIAPSSAEFPKRTVTFDAHDATQLALEFDVIARLLGAEAERD